MNRTVFLLLAAFSLQVGCVAAPETAHVKWSNQEPVVLPAPPATRPPVGRLYIHTPDSPVTDGSGEVQSWHRGYAIFDASGRLAYKCTGHSDLYDGITLRPGRYIAAAVVDDGAIDRRLETIQFVVEEGRSTTIDMTRKPSSRAASAPAEKTGS